MGQQLIDYIIDKFDGSIVEANKWRVNGSNGNHYWVEWHPFHKHYSCGYKGMPLESLVDTSKK